LGILLIWEPWYSMSASVLDSAYARSVGTATGKARGTSWAMIFPPFVIPSFPEGPACRKFGEGVVRVITDTPLGDCAPDCAPT
jgi:hypothetical protein